MKVRASDLEIPAEDVFRHDVLNRRPLIEGLSRLVSEITAPAVICIDAPWGMGKTTLLRMWNSHLAEGSVKPLYFNAWTTDFAPDPLVAFVSEIVSLTHQINPQTKTTKAANVLKKIGAQVARRALPVAAKLATAGLLDADSLTEDSTAELAKDLAGDAIDAYEKNKKLLADFRKALTALVNSLAKDGSRPRLLVLVDELDRCRPTYALELLERVKHLFDVPNVVFVLALDKAQLRASVNSIYGAETNSEEYLRRFLDLDLSLPPPKAEAFTDYLFEHFELRDAIAKRTHAEFRYDLQNVKATFNALASIFSLSLRTREQCIARLRVALLVTPTDEYIYPNVLTTLVILRAVAREAYQRFVSKDGTAKVVLDCIHERTGGRAFLDSADGEILEAFLISTSRGTGESNREIEDYRKLISDSNDPKNRVDARSVERATKIVSYFHEMRSRRGQMPNLLHIVPKIEFGVADRA